MINNIQAAIKYNYDTPKDYVIKFNNKILDGHLKIKDTALIAGSIIDIQDEGSIDQAEELDK